VSPGLTETDRVAEGLMAEARLANTSLDQARRRIVERIPMARMALPTEIADVVISLASPKAGYVTGVTLSMDGGQFRVVI